MYMGLSVGAALFGLGWLFLILFDLFREGFGGLNLSVFTEMTPPPGSAGGLLNAIVGSLILTGLGIAHRHAASACWPGPSWRNTAATTGSRR